MMKDFANMTPREIEDFLANASRERAIAEYERNKAKAVRFASFQREILADMMKDERELKIQAVETLKRECKISIEQSTSYFETLATIQDVMNSIDEVQSTPSRFQSQYDAACAVCGHLDNVDAEKATAADLVPVATAPQKSRLESVALIAVCAVIALVLILAVTGVMSIAR